MANMTPEEINAALIVSAYEAFSRGNIQSVLTTLAKDILWHVPGRGRCRVTTTDMTKYSDFRPLCAAV